VVLALGGVCAVLGMLGAGASLVVRLRRAVGVERQQLKWFVYVGAIASLGFVSSLLLRPWPELGILAMGVGFLGFGLTAIAAGIAVLRYRLYDIDLLINRTLVYAVLTACVVGIYVLVVTYFGAAFQARGDAVSLLAAGVVAVLFQPLRDRLQRGVNRLLYGQRDDPYGVLSRLGQRLESTLAPDAVLSTIVQTVRDALKLTYTAIALEQDGASALVAASGMRQGLLVELPLVYQAEPLGHLLLGPRAPGELFSPADRRLLDDLARQAGVAVHAVRLTADLQRARERLVTGREEERRRLRRDLHDGLGSQLAGLNIHAGVLRKLIAHDTAGAEAAAAELQAELRAAIASIRRLVRDLRPQAVDELGLIGAVRVRAAQYAEAELRIAVDAPEQLGPLPAAVEVATYRIVEEALTNAVRHAHAQNCDVRLTLADGALNLVIKDDGVGLTPGGTVGVGLLSMRERAMELGGTCLVRTGTHGGTEVLVRLPLPEE
jgi:signal transduction histidine kinase